MELGFWKWRRILIPALLLLLLLLRPIQADGGVCELPEFSHRKNSGWIANGGRRVVDSIQWPRMRKSSSSNAENSSILHYVQSRISSDNAVVCDLKFDPADRNDEPVCFAASSLKAGRTIQSFPIDECINDELDDVSLDEAPWEVKIASKLLRERSKGGASKWALYISSLPRHISLPLFFSDMEINNMEDDYIMHEISKMRQFALSSFYALRGLEIAHAKFSEYVWALSVAYSFGCKFGNEEKHYLFPFLGSTGTGSEQSAKLNLDQGSLKLVLSRNVAKGAAISFYRDNARRIDAFLFQGIVLKNDAVEEARLLSGLEDVADWFFSQYGGVNSNRVLTANIIRDSAQTFQELKNGNRIEPGTLTVNSKGRVSPSLACILSSLFYAKKAIEDHNRNLGGIAPIEFDIPGRTSWKKLIEVIASDQTTKNNEVSAAYSSAIGAVKDRIASLVARQSTDLVEDQFLLEAAKWEGISVPAEESCSSCLWQIDRQGPNDVLAVGFRSSSKQVLRATLSRQVPAPARAATSRRDSAVKLKNFSKWMTKRGFSISDKLTMTFMNNTSSEQEPVRGVLATREGETLCILPLDAGLYDQSPASETLKDSWDLAAVRLLQERALGKNSRWADYIGILPRDIASPLYLDSADLRELQWMPVLREVIQVRRSIRQSFQQFQSPSFTFEDYMWAVIMVHSRAFTLPVLPNDKYSHYVLMPYMDMINHHYTYQADWMSQPVIDRKLEIVAKRAVKKGEQLYASFGPRSNDNLFMYYGFVLEDNPFDSIQIFQSFEDATAWFIRSWKTTHCRDLVNDPVASSDCERRSWNKTWSAVKRSIEDFDNGSSGQSKDWWELVTHWADIGYQYLPYQPGPSVYAFGIADPSLVAAFQAASTFIDFGQPASTKARRETKNSSSESIEAFFACIENLRDKIDERSCRDHLFAALGRNGATRNDLIARVSIGLRCAEILAALPTSAAEDLELLRRRSSGSIRLAREFRYRKKLQLREVIRRVAAAAAGRRRNRAT